MSGLWKYKWRTIFSMNKIVIISLLVLLMSFSGNVLAHLCGDAELLFITNLKKIGKLMTTASINELVINHFDKSDYLVKILR